MKIYLDDTRQAPKGWVQTRTAPETTRLLKEHWAEITEVSLDHDLGPVTAGTGQHVLDYIEWRVYHEGTVPFEIKVHTANPVARQRMHTVVERIRKWVRS